MPILVITEQPGGTAEQDKAITEALNLANDPAPGALWRLAGPTDGGWRIVSLWDSQEAFDSFVRDRLTPALTQAGRPVPSFQFWPIESVIMMR
jgi:hypothetical protein